MKYHRVHILPEAKDLREAALFLVSSLLISHGARKDTMAIVQIEETWITAYGDKIRHLRPDQDSSEGWVKAVLYKGKYKKLGASITSTPIVPLSEGYCIGNGVIGLNNIKDIIHLESNNNVTLTFIYIDKTGKFINTCKESINLELEVPRPLRPALINIVLDRIEAGLKPI
ncbi:MAG: hypothetical protein GSR85_03695 [Desulfurococcales archaeon]|nr:hypothetical protein [Desulfurococcales archaeon]